MNRIDRNLLVYEAIKKNWNSTKTSDELNELTGRCQPRNIAIAEWRKR